MPNRHKHPHSTGGPDQAKRTATSASVGRRGTKLLRGRPRSRNSNASKILQIAAKTARAVVSRKRVRIENWNFMVPYLTPLAAPCGGEISGGGWSFRRFASMQMSVLFARLLFGGGFFLGFLALLAAQLAQVFDRFGHLRVVETGDFLSEPVGSRSNQSERKEHRHRGLYNPSNPHPGDEPRSPTPSSLSTGLSRYALHRSDQY